MDAQHRLDRLTSALRELRVEWERFFNGARQAPPEELREEIQQEIRALRNVNLRAVADRFRLAQVEARFNSFSELYNRRLRQVEEGRAPGVPVVAEREPAYDPARGVVLGGEMDGAAVEALYQELARGAGEGPRFDLESFRAYLGEQVGAMRARTGCSRVRFRLEPDGEKVKLKAKPLLAGD